MSDGSSNTSYNEDFLTLLLQSFKEVEDTRVCTVVSDFIGRPVHAVTVSTDQPLEGSGRSHQYYPTTPKRAAKPIYIGLIEDKHFVPLVKG